MKKILAGFCVAVLLSGQCFGAGNPFTTSGMSMFAVQAQARAASGTKRGSSTGLGAGELCVDAGQSGSDVDYVMPICSVQGEMKLAERGMKRGRKEIPVEGSTLQHNEMRDQASVFAVAPVSESAFSYAFSGDALNAANGKGAPAPTSVPASAPTSVPASAKKPFTSRQKYGLGIGGIGAGAAIGTLLYTLVQSLKTKERRRLMRIALDRVFGGSLEPLSGREEKIIRSLYRDLGIGAGGVALGALGGGMGAWLYRKK